MTTDNILNQLTEGTILEGPHWTEPVKILTAKSRGSRIEVQAVGTHTKRLAFGDVGRAHYREAIRGKSTAEFVSKIEGGLQELEETAYWLELLVGAEIVSEHRLQDLRNEANELSAILITCAKNAKRKTNAKNRVET